MPTVQRQLTRVWRWNSEMADCKSTAEEMSFIQEALQQYENEYQQDAMDAPQVFVRDIGNQTTRGYYQLNDHHIVIDYEKGKSRISYISVMEHEHEHAKQRMGEKGGYVGDAAVMAQLSFAIYPKHTVTPNGKHYYADYVYNYTELRALHAQANWVHNHYHSRLHAAHPDFFVNEKQELLAEMKELRHKIKICSKMSMAVSVNKDNASKLFWGKGNPEYAPPFGKMRMARFMRTTGKQLVKDAVHQLREMGKALDKDIAELEQMLSPERIEETKRQEIATMNAYFDRQHEEAMLEMKVKGFEFTTEFPTGYSYHVTQIPNIRMLNYYMHAFPPDVQNNPEYREHLKCVQCRGEGYMVCVPKQLIQGHDIDTTMVDRDAVAAMKDALTIVDPEQEIEVDVR